MIAGRIPARIFLIFTRYFALIPHYATVRQSLHGVQVQQEARGQREHLWQDLVRLVSYRCCSRTAQTEKLGSPSSRMGLMLSDTQRALCTVADTMRRRDVSNYHIQSTSLLSMLPADIGSISQLTASHELIFNRGTLTLTSKLHASHHQALRTPKSAMASTFKPSAEGSSASAADLRPCVSSTCPPITLYWLCRQLTLHRQKGPPSL